MGLLRKKLDIVLDTVLLWDETTQGNKKKKEEKKEEREEKEEEVVLGYSHKSVRT